MKLKNFLKKNIFINDFKRIKKNLLSFVSDFFLRTIVQIFYYPLMLLSWGIETTGTWIFVSSIPLLINIIIVDSSLYARQKIIITRINEHDHIYSNSLFLFLINSIIFLCIFYLFNYYFLENFEIIKSYSKFDKSFILLILIVGLTNIIDNINNFSYTMIETKGKIYYRNYIDNFFFICQSIIVVISGFYLTNIIYIGFIFIAISLSKAILVFYIKNKISNIRFNTKYIELKKFKIIFNESLRYHLLNLKGSIDNNGLNLIIGFFFNAEMLIVTSTLNVAFKLFYTRFASIVEEILTYEYANNFFNKNITKINLLTKGHGYFIIVFSLVFLSFVYFFGDAIYNLWTLNKFINYNDLILLVSLEAITLSYFNTNLVLLKSINRIKDVAIFNLVVTFLSYACMVILLTFFLEIKIVYYFMIINSTILFIYNMNRKNLILKNIRFN